MAGEITLNMWSGDNNNNDINEHQGEAHVPVLLYQPVTTSSIGSLHEQNNTSFAGGTYRDAPHPDCSSCHDSMHLMVCLSLPEKKHVYYVFGCNRASCGEELFTSSKFSLGGGGVFTVHQQKLEQTKEQVQQQQQKQQVVHAQDLNDNDWDLSDDDNDNDLEAMVAAMENMGSNKESKPVATQQVKAVTNQSFSQNTVKAFPCIELEAIPEPILFEEEQQTNSVDNEDTIGLDYSDGDDDKIQQMLARYMQDEDDEDILAALGGDNNGNAASGGGGGGEKEERLSREDRFLFTFMDRIKRAPHQVVRYGGGNPMWSVPTPTNNRKSSKGRKNIKNHRQQDNDEPTFPQIPQCPCCGARRGFEFQIMPSLLHILEVEEHAPKSSISHGTIESAFANGGMNWGTIAVYTCPNPDCNTREEFCIVQDSVDGKPTRRVVAATRDENNDDNELCG